MRAERLPAALLGALALACTGELVADGVGDSTRFAPVQPPALSFEAECLPGASITIAAVGDVLLHAPLQQQAVREAHRFQSLWPGVLDLLEGADLAYANLEGPVARGVNMSGQDVPDPGLVFDNRVYTSYPQFNYHPSLVEDLVGSGIDVVSTANNHALDRRALGVDRSVEALRAGGLPWTGTRSRADLAAPWHATTTAAGLTVAWLACTYSTNGIPDRDHQVLDCWADADEIVHAIEALSATESVDAVIVTPHWGGEYSTRPTLAQRELGRRFLDAGAIAILGSHPHVLQPWERYVTADGRETFVLYSLGNFVSDQAGLERRSSILLYLVLARGEDGRTRVRGVRHVPLYTVHEGVAREVVAIDREGGHADARSLVTQTFGEANLQDPDASIVFGACGDPEGPGPGPSPAPPKPGSPQPM